MKISVLRMFCILALFALLIGAPTFTQTMSKGLLTQDACKRTPEEERQLQVAIDFLDSKVNGTQISFKDPLDWRSANFSPDSQTDKCQVEILMRFKFRSDSEVSVFYFEFSLSDIDPISLKSFTPADSYGAGWVNFEASPGKQIIKRYPAIEQRSTERRNEAWLVVKDTEMANRVEKALKDAITLCCGKTGPY